MGTNEIFWLIFSLALFYGFHYWERERDRRRASNAQTDRDMREFLATFPTPTLSERDQAELREANRRFQARTRARQTITATLIAIVSAFVAAAALAVYVGTY